MIANSELTDGQRNYLRGLPLYPWAVWSRRAFATAIVTLRALLRARSLLHDADRVNQWLGEFRSQCRLSPPREDR
jgi:hypothetical protein